MHEGLSLFFALSLKLLETLVHVLAHLLRGLLLVVEFLFVHTVLSGEEHCEFLTALFEVEGVLSTHVCKSALDNLVLDLLVGLVLPLSSEGEILVTGEVGGELLHFLNI